MREIWRPWAITGGIAEGKSTVLGYLAEAGYRTVSADAVAREVFHRPGIQEELRVRLGVTDRDALLERLALDPDARRTLNHLMHAPVWEALSETGAQVVEIPLLVETVLHPRCAGVWVVTCGETEQLRRLTVRLGDELLARRLLQTQLSTRVKSMFADRIIESNLPEPQVRREVLDAAAHDFRQ